MAGTSKTGQFCPYSPSRPGQYRAVAEIAINGERGKYSAKSVLTVGSDDTGSRSISLVLGLSGETLTLTRTENGTYWLGDSQVTSGTIVAAANGNQYRITFEDGVLTVTYVPPPELAILLGPSGDVLTIHRSEDGTYWLGDSPINSGYTATASNGDRYMLTLGGDGTWTATLVANEGPSFGTSTVSGQTYTAGTLIASLTLPAAVGGQGTLAYSLSPGVPGLTFNPTSRRLSGTPSSAGSYAMTYTVTDAGGNTDSLTFTVTVNADAGSASRFNVGDSIPGIPSGFWFPSLVQTGKGASFVYSSGTSTLAWTTSDGVIAYDTFSWTCASSDGCEVVNGIVTKGTVVQSEEGG